MIKSLARDLKEGFRGAGLAHRHGHKRVRAKMLRPSKWMGSLEKPGGRMQVITEEERVARLLRMQPGEMASPAEKHSRGPQDGLLLSRGQPGSNGTGTQCLPRPGGRSASHSQVQRETNLYSLKWEVSCLKLAIYLER